MKSLLYIGAGLHLTPIETYRYMYKKFVFIDSLPINGYGYDYYYRAYYDGGFVEKLIQNMAEYCFNLENIHVLTDDFTEIECKYLESTLFIFTNIEKDITVHYYISTGIPRHLCEQNRIQILQNDISETDALIISGHFPDKEILKHIQLPIDLICYSKTWYPKDEYEIEIEDYETVIKEIIYEDFNKIVKSISHYDETNNIKNTFYNYPDFYKFYITYDN